MTLNAGICSLVVQKRESDRGVCRCLFPRELTLSYALSLLELESSKVDLTPKHTFRPMMTSEAVIIIIL